MQRNNLFSKFALSALFIASSCFIQADNVDWNSSRLPQVSSQSLIRSKNNLKKLNIKDLKGDWVYTASSVGGLTEGIGKSVTLDGRVTIKKNGKSKNLYAEGIRYAGVPDEFALFNYDDSNASLQFSIYDAELGVVSAIFNGPNGESLMRFTAIRSERTGEVVELTGHTISFMGAEFPTTSISTRTFKRQYTP